MCKHPGLAALLAVACACDCVAQDDAFPNKPMRWVVPFAPGGGTDVVVRPIAQKFSERVGQSILYDNRGGGGVIAGEIVALLHREAVNVLGQPDIIARLALDGASPVGSTPQEFAAQIRSDIARWANVIKTAGI